jgi:hypothetical protein
MILARVVLGKVSPLPDATRRRAPTGFDSTGSDAQGQFAVFENAACYPEYLISYRPSRVRARVRVC